MFDFPNNPVVNQSVTAPNGGFFIFDGVKWTNGAGPAPTLYIPISGGTMTGPLTLAANATQPMHAVPLQQLNTAMAGGPFLPTSGGTLSGQLTVDGPATSAVFKRTSTTAGGVSITPIGQYDPAPTTGSVFSNISSYVNSATNGGHFSDAVTYASMNWTTVYGAPNNNYFNGGNVLNFDGTGGTANLCALIGYATRLTAAAQPTTTVAATLSSPSGTVQVADTTHLQVPYPMTIAINGNPYTQTGVSAASGPGTITLSTLVSVADGTAGKTVMGNNNPQLWGANIYSVDGTGLDSLHTNASTGIELDISANGLDQPGIRNALNIVATQYNSAGTPCEIGAGVNIYAGNFTTFKRAIGVEAAFSQAVLDARGAVQNSGANAIWLAQGHRIAFDAGQTAALFLNTSGQLELDGSMYIGSAGAALHVLALGGSWSTANMGKQLFVECAPNYNTPAVGINDSTGAYPVAITSGGAGVINFWGMPALANNTTPPTLIATLGATGCGFNGHALTAKPTVTGAKGSNAALASLMTALAAYGLVTDSTTA